MAIDATEQARLVRDREASPGELVDEAIGRLGQARPWADRTPPVHAEGSLPRAR